MNLGGTIQSITLDFQFLASSPAPHAQPPACSLDLLYPVYAPPHLIHPLSGLEEGGLDSFLHWVGGTCTLQRLCHLPGAFPACLLFALQDWLGPCSTCMLFLPDSYSPRGWGRISSCESYLTQQGSHHPTSRWQIPCLSRPLVPL